MKPGTKFAIWYSGSISIGLVVSFWLWMDVFRDNPAWWTLPVSMAPFAVLMMIGMINAGFFE